mmetsp:Transcript_38117/g.61721  ORF Transcript_38117/g.61721 Transcript_38117/m.61721 type:complete len:925 (-) Transcript_38117:230-3004(-)
MNLLRDLLFLILIHKVFAIHHLADPHLHHRKILLSSGVIDTSTDRPRHTFNDEDPLQDAARIFLVHVKGPASHETTAHLEKACGVSLKKYIPHNTYLITANRIRTDCLRSSEHVLWIDALRKEHKVLSGAHVSNRIYVHFLPTDDESLHQIVERWAKELRSVLGTDRTVFENVGEELMEVVLPDDSFSEKFIHFAAHQPLVRWVECRTPISLQNKYASRIVQTASQTTSNANSDAIHDQGLHGEGEIVGVVDGGLDYDHCFFSPPVAGGSSWADPNARKVVAYISVSGADERNTANTEHGTHVTGSILGEISALNYPVATVSALSPYQGVAYKARAVFTNILSPAGEGVLIGVDPDVTFQKAHDYGARLHSNSWGCFNNTHPTACNVYSTDSALVDKYMWRNQDSLVLFAAGNYGGSGGRTLTSPSTCKNCLTVGASLTSQEGFVDDLNNFRAEDCCATMFDSACSSCGTGGDPSCCASTVQSPSFASIFTADNLASFSSRGPTSDGRIKPDVVSPGSWITSAWSDNNKRTNQCGVGKTGTTGAALGSLQGTSMATPITAGAIALIRQYFREGWFPSGTKTAADAREPTGSLMKAMVINGARYMTGKILRSGYVNDGPLPTTAPNPLQGFGRTRLDTVLRFPTSSFRLAVCEDKAPGIGQFVDVEVDLLAGSSPFKATLVWTDPPPSESSATVLVNDLDLTVISSTNVVRHANGLNDFDHVNTVEQIELDSTVQGRHTVRISVSAIPYQQRYSLVITGNWANITNCPSTASPGGSSASPPGVTDNGSESGTTTNTWLIIVIAAGGGAAVLIILASTVVIIRKQAQMRKYRNQQAARTQQHHQQQQQQANLPLPHPIVNQTILPPYGYPLTPTGGASPYGSPPVAPPLQPYPQAPAPPPGYPYAMPISLYPQYQAPPSAPPQTRL